MAIAETSAIQIVCVAVGEGASMDHVARLQSMISRHLALPFILRCVVDRPQSLPEGVTAIDASSWTPPRPGMRPTVRKLGLFDPQAMPIDEFFYFDTSLVIQKNLQPLIEYANARSEELVVVRDWTYDTFNTCVMRIRTGGVLAGIPTAYAQGVEYPQKTPGDQDYVTGYVREKGLENRVAFFPPDMIASYKVARAKARKGLPEGQDTLEAAIIVKFHGRPKMEEILNPWSRLFRLRLMKPKTGRVDSTFWVQDLRERWR